MVGRPTGPEEDRPAGGIGLDDLEAEGLLVEGRAHLGVTHPEHGVVEAADRHEDQPAWSVASMSSSIETFSPTMIPPVSSTAL